MADAHEEKALLGLCNAHCLRLLYLPRLARAARRVQGPRSSTFRKLDTGACLAGGGEIE